MESDGEKVFLYIYDLSQGMARQLSATFLGNTIEGIWHSGIGLYGKEYFYGAGIQCVPIGQSPFGVPVNVLELGFTHIPKDIFEEFLQEIGPRYTMATYSLLNHNCNNFTDEAAQFLVGSGIPHHILRQADVALNHPLGALMLPMLQQLETTLRHGGVPVAPANHAAAAAAGPSPSPIPSSRVFMSRESSSSFPAPFPPVAASPVPPATVVPHAEPAASARRADQRRTDREKVMDVDKVQKSKGTCCWSLNGVTVAVWLHICIIDRAWQMEPKLLLWIQSSISSSAYQMQVSPTWRCTASATLDLKLASANHPHQKMS